MTFDRFHKPGTGWAAAGPLPCNADGIREGPTGIPSLTTIGIGGVYFDLWEDIGERSIPDGITTLKWGAEILSCQPQACIRYLPLRSLGSTR